ncbi:MAG TPA: UDP-N-acetylmuramoyl-L-alanyl-D-glutamate--2,6-diaminopimelate ligase [Aeromicrobium sp.]|nr:UDP-N-acetylmuramoyl-L-alanyl-D-glutamate--2,6-diaminopimelate ligase [Aeromicrobium sp.]
MRPESRPARSPEHALAEVAGFLRADPVSGSNPVVHGLSLATQRVRPGDLFLALPGTRAHGIDFADEAVSRGAVAVLTDPEGAVRFSDAPLLVVETPRAQLADLSAWFYDYPATSFTTVGITGTQGKTTTTYLAEAALGSRRAGVIGTIGTRIGRQTVVSALTTPEAPDLQALFAVMRESEVEACVMEVSSHALVLGRVDGVVFDTAVFLNLGRDHLDFHHTMEEYFLAKAALFTPERARQAVINVDDEHGRALVDLVGDRLPVATFSTSGRAAAWRAVNVRPGRSGTDLEVLTPQDGSLPLSVPLPGAFNVSNALAALVALASCGFDAGELASGIAESTGVPGRMERIDVGQEFTAVVDYAHKPDAVTAVLSALRPVTAGRLIVVVGAGGDRDQGKRPLIGAAAAQLADLVIVTDDNPRTEHPASIRAEVLSGAAAGPGAAIEVADRAEAISHAVALAHRGDTVVVAGKGHESGQEIAGVLHPFDDREVLSAAISERLGRAS